MHYVLTIGDTIDYALPPSYSASSMVGGTIIATLLTGLALGQLLTFCTHANRFSRLEQAVVAAVAAFGFATFGLQWATLQWLAVDNFGSPDALVAPTTKSFGQMVALGVPTRAITQAFYAQRAWRLWDQNLFLATFLALAVLTVAALDSFVSVKLVQGSESIAAYVQVLDPITRFGEICASESPRPR